MLLLWSLTRRNHWSEGVLYNSTPDQRYHGVEFTRLSFCRHVSPLDAVRASPAELKSAPIRRLRQQTGGQGQGQHIQRAVGSNRRL